MVEEVRAKLYYASLFDIESDKMTVNNGKLCLPVKITQENKEKIKFTESSSINVRFNGSSG